MRSLIVNQCSEIIMEEKNKHSFDPAQYKAMHMKKKKYIERCLVHFHFFKNLVVSGG